MGKKISDENLIWDLQRVAGEFELESVTAEQYEQRGRYSWTPYVRRFGTWNKALERAGLGVSREQDISEDKLLEDLQRVARELEVQKLTMDQYKKHGSYSRTSQRSRFGSWNKALKRAGLTVSNEQDILDGELLEDLQRVARELGAQKLTMDQYKKHGIYSCEPYFRSFGSWNKALEQADLLVSRERNIPDDRLFEDLQRVARELSVQTVSKDQYQEYGNYSCPAYQSRFGSWSKALQRAGLKTFAEISVSLPIELLLPHADILSEILRSLRHTQTDLSSDHLWQAIKKRWSEQELISAVEAFRATENLTAFHVLLSHR